MGYGNAYGGKKKKVKKPKGKQSWQKALYLRM